MPLKLSCRVERIVNHGEHVYSVDLRPERPAPRFRAGQFLHLALDPYDPTAFWPESRAFSIASSPTERQLLRILYSVRGRFTARMEAELAEGCHVWIRMPYGDFVIDDRHDVVLLAGGTGMSAFTAFLEQLPPDFGHTVVLAYGARSERLLIYRDIVESCTARVERLRPYYFIEERPVTDEADHKASFAGRVSVDVMWPIVSRLQDTAYYISGPPMMLKKIAGDLRDRGVDLKAIHIDAWE